jgi:hypothetical protein
MKATLEFDTSNPDDKMELKRAMLSTDMAIVLHELLHNYRKRFTRELEADEKSTEREFEIVDKIFTSIWELCEESGINIDQIIE